VNHLKISRRQEVGVHEAICHTVKQQNHCDCGTELELELIQTQMTQKPVLRAEVYARALRASQNRK
jgi:hypothetical protein